MISYCLLLLSVSARAAEDQLQGPLAVLALFSGQETASLARATEELYRHLQQQSNQIPILTKEKMAMLLSGGERDASAPTSLERLHGIFQQGYIQSYSFEYEKALETFNRVLSGLGLLPFCPERWQLWTKAKIFEGLSLLGLERKADALQSFVTVLRTRPTMQLDRREYSPHILQLWNQAKNALPSLPKGRLAVDSDPQGAKVFLDGAEVGTTPFIGSPSQGRYHLHVSHPEAGSASRWIDIGAEPVRLRLQLAFEGALVLESSFPGIKLATSEEEFPTYWWSWLGERLGVKNLVVLFQRQQKQRWLLGAALVDLERGSRLREGWLEWQPESLDETRKAVAELADFLVTGKVSPIIQVRPPDADKWSPPSGLSTTVPFTVEEAPRPWWRKFWPWGVGAGGLAVAAVASHLLARHFREEAEAASAIRTRDHYDALADGMLGGAIAADVLAAGCLATGLLLYYSYHPEEKTADENALLPTLLSPGIGLVWRQKF